MASPPAGRVSWVLLVVVAVAIAVGATASILVNPNMTSPAGSSSGPTQQVQLPNWVFAAAILAVMIVVLIVWIIIRIDAKGQRGISSNAFISLLFAIGVISLLVIVLHLLGVGGSSQNSGNDTNITPPPPPPTVPPSTGPPLTGAGSVFVAPSVPAWVPLVIIAIVVVVAVTVGVPQTRRYLSERRAEAGDRRRANAPRASPAVHDALSRASYELDLGQDPRTVILALYQEMLVHLRPMSGSVESATPEEIRTTYLEHYGVRHGAARTLTRLFEEARYSTHPLGPAERDRARDAVRAAIDDLDRRASPSS
jgi:hypothetical protein